MLSINFGYAKGIIGYSINEGERIVDILSKDKLSISISENRRI